MAEQDEELKQANDLDLNSESGQNNPPPAANEVGVDKEKEQIVEENTPTNSLSAVPEGEDIQKPVEQDSYTLNPNAPDKDISVKGDMEDLGPSMTIQGELPPDTPLEAKTDENAKAGEKMTFTDGFKLSKDIKNKVKGDYAEGSFTGVLKSAFSAKAPEDMVANLMLGMLFVLPNYLSYRLDLSTAKDEAKRQYVKDKAKEYNAKVLDMKGISGKQANDYLYQDFLKYENDPQKRNAALMAENPKIFEKLSPVGENKYTEKDQEKIDRAALNYRHEALYGRTMLKSESDAALKEARSFPKIPATNLDIPNLTPFKDDQRAAAQTASIEQTAGAQFDKQAQAIQGIMENLAKKDPNMFAHIKPDENGNLSAEQQQEVMRIIEANGQGDALRQAMADARANQGVTGIPAPAVVIDKNVDLKPAEPTVDLSMPVPKIPSGIQLSDKAQENLANNGGPNISIPKGVGLKKALEMTVNQASTANLSVEVKDFKAKAAGVQQEVARVNAVDQRLRDAQTPDRNVQNRTAQTREATRE